MRCCRIKKRISSFIDGEIQGKEKAKIEAHLNSCPECRNEAEKLKQVNMILDTMPSVSTPPFLANRVLARVKGEINEKRSLNFLPAWMRWATALTAVLVGLSIGAGMGQKISRDVFWKQKEAIEIMAWEEDLEPIEPITWMMREMAEEEGI